MQWATLASGVALLVAGAHPLPEPPVEPAERLCMVVVVVAVAGGLARQAPRPMQEALEARVTRL